MDPHEANARRDFAIGRGLSILPLVVWPLLYAERFVTAPLAVMDRIHVLLFGFVFAAMLCTLPLILYTFRVMRTSVPAWQKALVGAGLVAGVASYGLVLLAFLGGLGLAMGAH